MTANAAVADAIVADANVADASAECCGGFSCEGCPLFFVFLFADGCKDEDEEGRS
jgi:hypothetical protein